MALLDDIPPDIDGARADGASTIGIWADRAWAQAVLARAVLRADLHEPAGLGLSGHGPTR